MSNIDWAVIGIGVLGLALWVRGCSRSSPADCTLGLTLGIVAALFYFYLFSLTRSQWLAAELFGAFFLTLLPFGKFWRGLVGRIFAVALVVLIAAAVVVENKFVSAGNALLIIEPYRLAKTWVFDEPRLHLQHEPFVQGIPEMIDRLVKDIPGSDQSVRLIFSQQQFPGAQLQLDWRREQGGGNWYFSEEYQMEGWLCPALFKFFPRAPQHIYVKAEQK